MRIAYAQWFVTLTIVILALANPPDASAVPVPSDYQVVSVPLDIGARDCWINIVTNRIYVEGSTFTVPYQNEAFSIDGETLTVRGEIADGNILSLSCSEAHSMLVAVYDFGGYPHSIVLLDAETEGVRGEYRLEGAERFRGAALFDEVDILVMNTFIEDSELFTHHDVRVFSMPSVQQIRLFEEVVVDWQADPGYWQVSADHKRLRVFYLYSRGQTEVPEDVSIDVFDARRMRFEARLALPCPPELDPYQFWYSWSWWDTRNGYAVLDRTGTLYGSLSSHAGDYGYFFKVHGAPLRLDMLERSTRPRCAAVACANNVTDRAYFSPPLWYMRGDTDEPHRVGGGDLYPGVGAPAGQRYEMLKVNEWTNTIYAYESRDSSRDYVDIYDGKNETSVRIDLGRSIYDGCIDKTRHRAYFVCSNDILSEGYLVAVIPIDPDGDGLVRGDEDLNDDGDLDPDESDPNVYDTDGDGINDGFERGRMTDPSNPDTDGDGLTDLEEDPNINLLLDPGETDPLDPDCDDDGVLDGDDPWPWDAEWSTDADSDGLPDEWELYYFGSLDEGPLDDYDGDGCDNYTEWQFGADPTDSSSYVPAMLTAGMVLLIALLTGTAAHRRKGGNTGPLKKPLNP